MKKLLCLLFLGFAFQFVHAQSAGATGLSYLKIGIGARNIALGDNGATFATDATSLFYNTANIAANSTSEVFVMHNSWIQGVSAEALAVKFNFLGLPIAAGLNSTNINDIEIRTVPGDAQGTFNAHYFSLGAGTGFNLTDHLNAGFGVKFLYEDIFSDESKGYGIDLGLTYNRVIDNLTAVATLTNIGSTTELRYEKTKLPTELRFGGIYDLPELQKLFTSRISAEYQKFTAESDSHLNIGFEAVYNAMFALRFGYMTNYDSKGFTAGLGFHWNIVDVDYAFAPFKYDLGSSHTVSIKAAL
jgi:hypothetical protein